MAHTCVRIPIEIPEPAQFVYLGAAGLLPITLMLGVYLWASPGPFAIFGPILVGICIAILILQGCTPYLVGVWSLLLVFGVYLWDEDRKQLILLPPGQNSTSNSPTTSTNLIVGQILVGICFFIYVVNLCMTLVILIMAERPSSKCSSILCVLWLTMFVLGPKLHLVGPMLFGMLHFSLALLLIDMSYIKSADVAEIPHGSVV